MTIKARLLFDVSGKIFQHILITKEGLTPEGLDKGLTERIYTVHTDRRVITTERDREEVVAIITDSDPELHYDNFGTEEE